MWDSRCSWRWWWWWWWWCYARFLRRVEWSVDAKVSENRSVSNICAWRWIHQVYYETLVSTDRFTRRKNLGEHHYHRFTHFDTLLTWIWMTCFQNANQRTEKIWMRHYFKNSTDLDVFDSTEFDWFSNLTEMHDAMKFVSLQARHDVSSLVHCMRFRDLIEGSGLMLW
jgi:hypothetical protein